MTTSSRPATNRGYSERRWRPVRWWEIAAMRVPADLLFAAYFPGFEAPSPSADSREQARDPSGEAPDPWGEDTEIIASWFARGESRAFHAEMVLAFAAEG